MNELILFWLRLLYRAVVRIDRKLEQVIINQQDVVKIAQLTSDLRQSSNRLEEATRKQQQ